MVTSIFVHNLTDYSFNCFPILECEDENSKTNSPNNQTYWENLKYYVRAKNTIKMADLTRDYFFKTGQSYYFSIYLMVTLDPENAFIVAKKLKVNSTRYKALDYSEVHSLIYNGKPHVDTPCLILKVKNYDTNIHENLLYGVHSFPFGSTTPTFFWKHSSDWVKFSLIASTYFRFASFVHFISTFF